MKNIYPHTNHHPETVVSNTTDSVVSHILMGFVERKISPQTIADVLRAQIFESGIPIHLLSPETSNGILEAVTNANSTEDCVDLIFYLCGHDKFPAFLSLKSSTGILRTLLRYAQKNNSVEMLTEHSIENIIEKLSECALNFFHSGKSIDAFDKTQLMNSLQTLPSAFSQLMRSCVHFQHLRFLLLTPQNELLESCLVEGTLPQVLDVLRVIMETPDETLAQKGVSFYKSEPVEKNSSSRLRHYYTFLDAIKENQFTDFKVSFLMEWLFEKSLVDAVVNEFTTYEFIATVKNCAENCCSHIPIMKGLIRAIQKDFSFLGAHPIQKTNDHQPNLLDKARKLTQHLFPPLVTLAEKDFHFVSKNIANWAVEQNVPKEEFRFFKKSDCRWIRVLGQKSWDSSLQELPEWILEKGSLYAAIIIHCAPGNWIQEHSFPLFEKIYKKSLAESFVPQPEHINYIEFIIRATRKKSSIFCSRMETIYALHLLSKLSNNEAFLYENFVKKFETQLENWKVSGSEISSEFHLWKEIYNHVSGENILGDNKVTKAMAVLARLAFEIQNTK